MPIPTIPESDGHGQTDRERTLAKSEWTVDVTNFKEIGEAIASFSRLVDSYEYFGTAEVKLEGTVRQLTIILCFDEEQRLTCAICHRVPARPTSDNPAICTVCGEKVCAICWKKHEQGHWRPPIKTLGGERIPF